VLPLGLRGGSPETGAGADQVVAVLFRIGCMRSPPLGSSLTPRRIGRGSAFGDDRLQVGALQQIVRPRFFSYLIQQSPRFGPMPRSF
jgi:hypothetical protein